MFPKYVNIRMINKAKNIDKLIVFNVTSWCHWCFQKNIFWLEILKIQLITVPKSVMFDLMLVVGSSVVLRNMESESGESTRRENLKWLRVRFPILHWGLLRWKECCEIFQSYTFTLFGTWFCSHPKRLKQVTGNEIHAIVYMNKLEPFNI